METIFDYIISEEIKYAEPTDLADGWSWNMKEHLNRSFLYLNSQFEDNNSNRELRPFKNIVLPILNIQFRTEGFDVKDINLYVDNKDEYFKSFLINKYHERWARENDIDTFIDEVTESYGTYGGVMVRKTKQVKPEVIDLRSLAYCSQNDILNNPFAIKHEMSFSELRKEAKLRDWGGEGSDIDIEDLISLVKKEDKEKNSIVIYECHGSMPTEWLDDTEDEKGESEMDLGQIQIVAFYRKEDGKKQGVCLLKKKMPELPFKFLKRDDIKNRALGRGGVEELFESQIWTNWDEVKITEMLDSASKTLFVSDDPSFKTRNNLNDVENNEVFNLQEGRKIGKIDTYPQNINLFNSSVDRFWQHAQIIGSASDAMMGAAPTSGTPFKSYEAQQMESRGMHKYRQGKLAVFMDEIYRDWILPHLAKEIVKEQNFMEELSFDEMQMVTEKVITKKTNNFKKRMVLSLQDIDEDLIMAFQNQIKADLAKKGNKWFFKILKDEMKDISISVMTNIAGKQKNLSLLTDKVVNVLRQYIATPQIRQDPEMGKLLNTILESSGLSPISFSSAIQVPQQQAPQQGGGGTAPLKELAEGQVNQPQV